MRELILLTALWTQGRSRWGPTAEGWSWDRGPSEGEDGVNWKVSSVRSLSHSHSLKYFEKNGCCRVYLLEPRKKRKPGGGSLRRMSSESDSLKITFRGRWFPVQGHTLRLFGAVTALVLWEALPNATTFSQSFRITFLNRVCALLLLKLSQRIQNFYSDD